MFAKKRASIKRGKVERVPMGVRGKGHSVNKKKKK